MYTTGVNRRNRAREQISRRRFDARFTRVIDARLRFIPSYSRSRAAYLTGRRARRFLFSLSLFSSRLGSKSSREIPSVQQIFFDNLIDHVESDSRSLLKISRPSVLSAKSAEAIRENFQSLTDVNSRKRCGEELFSLPRDSTIISRYHLIIQHLPQFSDASYPTTEVSPRSLVLTPTTFFTAITSKFVQGASTLLYRSRCAH